MDSDNWVSSPGVECLWRFRCYFARICIWIPTFGQEAARVLGFRRIGDPSLPYRRFVLQRLVWRRLAETLSGPDLTTNSSHFAQVT